MSNRFYTSLAVLMGVSLGGLISKAILIPSTENILDIFFLAGLTVYWILKVTEPTKENK